MKRNIFLGCLTVTLAFLVFSPSEIFFRNPSEFGIGIWEFLASAIGLSAAFSAIMFGILSMAVHVFTEEVASRLAAAVTSLGLAAFLQGTYLGWGFGPLDGSAIDWSQPLSLKILGACIWLCPLILPQVVEGLRTQNLIRTVCIALLAIQTGLLGFQLATYDHFQSYKDYSADRTNLMQFSSTQNAIVLVLDEFQCDIFEEVLTREPALSDALAGFTYFPDAVASSSQTFPSVPALLTGQFYDNSQTAEKYIAEAYRNSLPAQLRQARVRSELYPVIPGTVLTSPRIADNAIVRSYSFAAYARTVYFGMLRAFPVVLKRLTIRLERWRDNRSNARTPPQTTRTPPPLAEKLWSMGSFRSSLASAQVSDLPATFKFIHLEGTHVPIYLDENLNAIDAVYSRESFIRQATGVVRLLAQMVQRLETLGIYESSVVMIVGDHGSGREPGMWLNPTDKTKTTFNTFKARGCPLFLAKPVGAATGRMQISSAPVSLTDVPPTILSELGISPAKSETRISGLPGPQPFSEAKSVFSIEDAESRIRGYYGYLWTEFEPSYLPPISEFIIDGNVRQDASWQAGRTFVAE